ncbi:hypothetical protein Gotri_013171, partial [Gossypium trilobum]|nr:hypothetical protein [Gossypium trilobum]
MYLFRLILFNNMEILMTLSVRVIGVLELLTEALEGFLEVEVMQVHCHQFQESSISSCAHCCSHA